MSAAATTYEPKPGSVAQRAIAHLESLEPGASLTSAALAEAIGVDPAVISGSLESPLKAGVVRANQRGGHPKSPRFWTLAQPRTNGRTVGLEPAADGSQKPNGEATAAVRPAKAGSDSPRPGPQHVVKAKAARPDATDREPPATASPRGGAMGVGQAAAAAPAGGLRIALWSDGELQIMRGPGKDGVVEMLFFSAEETRQLVHYLDRMAVDEEASA